MPNKPKTIEIGTAKSVPGTYQYGSLELMALPTGGSDNFPIIIAQGETDGPVLWVTASIHGDEYTGIQVIHQLLGEDLPRRIHGTLIAVPTLNPAALRVGERTAYYLRRQDPNRLFPSPQRRGVSSTEDAPLNALELAFRRLFDHIKGTADYLIDLHNYSIGAIPFAFCDPVYYIDERERPAAQKLFATTRAMLKAFGHTVINEFVSAEYLKKGLHRSVSGAAILVGRIPAFTAELGGYLTIDPTIVRAAAAGIRNVMRWGGMLDGEPEPIEGIAVIDPGYPIRRTHHPYVAQSGVVQFLVKAGDAVNVGQTVARLTDIYGRPLGPDNGAIRTNYAGVVLSLLQGAIFYQNEPIMNLAVKDESVMVLPYPA